ncbi:hypothetical protein TNCV_1912161 [Trichonephila clavipes]|nr:hypothetical protein TNCV_1912161 [Trichonephila clavipes]
MQMIRISVQTHITHARGATSKRYSRLGNFDEISALTIRRHLQQSGLSARRPLLGLPLTQNQMSPPRMVR